MWRMHLGPSTRAALLVVILGCSRGGGCLGGEPAIADAGVLDVAAVDSGNLLERAERCLADIACPAADADRLFIEADDAHSGDCMRFIDGAGTRRDLARGRACLERSAGSPCDADSEGSVVGNAEAELAVMLIDGVGGKQDIPRARALFASCHDERIASWLLAQADAKEQDPKAPPTNFCAWGGNTLTSDACLARDRTNEETRGQLQAKAVAQGLDENGKVLFASATKAYGAYVAAMGMHAYQAYIEGSVRNAVALVRERELLRYRTEQLASLAAFVAPDTSAEDVARAEKGAAEALAAVKSQTADETEALKKTEDTWTAYRDAEAAFYVQVLGQKQGAERVRSAVLVRLEKQRAKDCAPPAP